MPSGVRITAQGKVEDLGGKEAAKHGYLAHLDAMVVLIQDLIPLGHQAFAEVLQAEVAAVAGARYSRTGGRPGVVRWGQKVPRAHHRSAGDSTFKWTSLRGLGQI